ncbi:orotidine-5'-phosphate decarboxylase [Candidatus Sumerlaeota bacterium]|nr:orotidine-5'-phosphate decarboxylase [Candidatus Sumerlaeota bacterium]
MDSVFMQKIQRAVDATGSLVCVGLDLDPEKMPERFRSFPDGFADFAKAIIEATVDAAAAYKPNAAFYERYGAEGWRLLERIREWIPDDRVAICDAKRGDIGNTSRMYAQAIFETLGYDAVTLSPYMGRDSLAPFFEFSAHGSFVLCATSNPGADDFQTPRGLHLDVARKCVEWNTKENIGLVVGATRTDCMTEVRKLTPDMPFLVPGIGAQGGDLEAVLKAGLNAGGGGMLINASRSILYASTGDDFAEAAAAETIRMRDMIRAGSRGL